MFLMYFTFLDKEPISKAVHASFWKGNFTNLYRTHEQINSFRRHKPSIILLWPTRDDFTRQRESFRLEGVKLVKKKTWSSVWGFNQVFNKAISISITKYESEESTSRSIELLVFPRYKWIYLPWNTYYTCICHCVSTMTYASAVNISR